MIIYNLFFTKYTLTTMSCIRFIKGHSAGLTAHCRFLDKKIPRSAERGKFGGYSFAVGF